MKAIRIQKSDVLDAIIARAACISASSTPTPINFQSAYIQYLSPPVEVRVNPVMHTSEIELNLILQNLEKKYSQSSIQVWLGEPVRAYMFSIDTVSIAVDNVANAVMLIFEKLAKNFNEEIQALETVNQILSLDSINNSTREGANQAWSERRYRDSTELYASLKGNLSPLEAKRLEMARKYMSQK